LSNILVFDDIYFHFFNATAYRSFLLSKIPPHAGARNSLFAKSGRERMLFSTTTFSVTCVYSISITAMQHCRKGVTSPYETNFVQLCPGRYTRSLHGLLPAIEPNTRE
jgi:F0F1-type ATP synthase beta subunit